jgi:hypothetical protein
MEHSEKKEKDGERVMVIEKRRKKPRYRIEGQSLTMRRKIGKEETSHSSSCLYSQLLSRRWKELWFKASPGKKNYCDSTPSSSNLNQ